MADAVTGNDGSGRGEEAASGVGTLAEEAARLAEALAGFGRAATDGFREDLPDGHARFAERCSCGRELDGSCRLCPVCQVLDVLRATRPQVYAHLSTAAAALLAAVRELVGAAAEGTAGRTHRDVPVQHIDIE